MLVVGCSNREMSRPLALYIPIQPRSRPYPLAPGPPFESVHHWLVYPTPSPTDVALLVCWFNGLPAISGSLLHGVSGIDSGTKSGVWQCGTRQPMGNQVIAAPYYVIKAL